MERLNDKAGSFGDALLALKEGKRVRRKGWNGKGMFLFLVPGSQFKVNREPLLSMLGEGTVVDYHAHIDMRRQRVQPEDRRARSHVPANHS